MGHVPHLYLGAPWPDAAIPLPDDTRHHLERVLRIRPGASVSYTDGAGTVGDGRIDGGHVVRGEERSVAPPAPAVTVAVAPPRSKDRARFVVEKLAELGIDRLVWLITRHGEGKPPPWPRSRAWAEAALEQSRGAHLMGIAGPTPIAELTAPLWVATQGAELPPATDTAVTLAVGPEGGFSAGDTAPGATPVGLGSRVLRTETAAVVGATLVLAAAGRLSVVPPQ